MSKEFEIITEKDEQGNVVKATIKHADDKETKKKTESK